MLTVFKTELTETLTKDLLHFAIRCGASEFTVRPLVGQSELLPVEQLQPFLIGHRKKELPSESPRRKFEAVEVWSLNEQAIATILTLCPRGFRATAFEWVIYRRSCICMVARPGAERSHMCLMHTEWEELFRLGFRFSLYMADGKLHTKEFTELDLPENKNKKLVARYPGLAKFVPRSAKTVDEVFANPYGVMSFPPTYGYPRINPDAANNNHILSWWSPSHDDLLRRHIERDGWRWWPSTSALSQITGEELFTRWQIDDPDCLSRSWADVLAAFARARAVQLGLLHGISYPADARECDICYEMFSPSTHHPSLREASPLSERYCSPCLHESFVQSNASATKEECLEYVRRLAELLGRIPSSDFWINSVDLESLDASNATEVLLLLRTKPRTERIKDHFGSWLGALVAAGILEDGTRKMQRGTQCIAHDGHVCLSLAEKTIDDLLTNLGVPHEKEVKYPEGAFRCDFFANGVYIEYFGLTGDREYDIKTKEKLLLAERLGIRMLALYPHDVVRHSALRQRLTMLLSSPNT